MNAFAVSSILIIISNISLAILILWKGKNKVINRIWAAFCLCVTLWGILGYKISTITSAQESFFWWQITYIGPIFVPVLYYHFLYVWLGLRKKINRYILFISYIFGFIFSYISLLSPKKFFGSLDLLFGHIYMPSSNYKYPVFLFFYISFYLILLLYAFWQLIVSYKNSQGITKNQLKYFLLASIIGWIGPHGDLIIVVFPILIYPYTNFLIAIYPIIFTYAILKYQLMDINIVIKKAFFYSLGIALVSGLIFGISFLNSWFAEHFSGFRSWMIPLISGIVAFFIGNIFWKKSREVDKLKYEFITVAAHKLRTPLTEIKWGLNSLENEISKGTIEKEPGNKLISKIKASNSQLIELANELLNVAKTEGKEYEYKIEKTDLAELTKKILRNYENKTKEKNIKLNTHFEINLPKINLDKMRIGSVIQILLDNAILYTKDRINISIETHGRNITFHIEDNGIGIPKENQQYIFSRFYRTHEAYLKETEGSGISLFLAKNIIEKHGGKIGVRSEGIKKGSIFWFSLKIDMD